jgi:hypothetical protein
MCGLVLDKATHLKTGIFCLTLRFNILVVLKIFLSASLPLILKSDCLLCVSPATLINDRHVM